MSDILDDLDSLLIGAQIEAAGRKKVVATRRDWDENYRASFRAPENWALHGQAQLIHVEDNVRTLIGLYDDLRHVKVPRCRKLVRCTERREDLPLLLEEVTGSQWLPSEAWTLRHRPTTRSVEFLTDLELDMGQSLVVECVLVVAHLVGGGLQRLCLKEDTMFSGTTPRTMLSLPAGLDILEGLSNQCKINLWKEINAHTAAAE